MKGKVTKFDSKIMTAEFMEDGKEIVYVADKKRLIGAEISSLNIGDEVFFEVGNPQGNNRFKVRKILAEEVITQEDIFEKVALPERNNKLYLDNSNSPFSNPYNFVPIVEIPKEKFADKIVKFRKPFVPHDKFEGLSGIITCRLKTLTPFFTSGTHKEEEKGKHKHLDLFSIDKEKINGQENKWRMPIVAGSTLRGVIRSVCEAVSSSSFTALNGETLDYRVINEASSLKCGIIEKIPTRNLKGEIKILESVKLPFHKIPKGAIDNGEGWRDKNDKYVIANPNNNGYEKGYFKLTGQNTIDKKKNERFFFEKNGKTVSFSIEEMNKYNKLIKEQNKNAKKSFDNDNSDIVAKEIKERKNHPLEKGHLVYFQSAEKNTAKNLGYVSIPRWQYKSSIADKIDNFFHPVEDADSLCPTSRIFGFVRDKKFSQKKYNEGKSAYAGRVYFSDANFDTSKGKVKYDENVVLDILGSPKPTTYEFYLYNSKNKSDIGTSKYPKDYNNSDMKLRGRKFYLHQENKGQYRRKFDNDEKKHLTSQNSTLKRVLAEGNEFTFSVRFDNLEDYELGLLLWGIALESGMAHKVGMGKPLGLGSVSIKVESVEIITRETRYSSFLKDDNTFQDGKAKNDGKAENDNWKADYITKFTDWMEDVFGFKFEDLENVMALKKILGNIKELENNKEMLEFQNSDTKPIHYPLCENTDEKQFEWFVANRRDDNPQILPFPSPVNGVADNLKRNRKAR